MFRNKLLPILCAVGLAAAVSFSASASERIPEDRITLVDYPDQMAAQLKLFPNDNIYVLYGADAIKYAKGVYRDAVRLCQEKMQEEAVPAIEEAKA